MNGNFGVLVATAASIGIVHTALGPDHYVPFIALAKAREWSLRKTALVTGFCGLGHVLGSIVLGLVGLLIGSAVFSLEAIEAVRGEIAGWMLFGFGFAYLVYGVWSAIRNRPHSHIHTHGNGETHSHVHSHVADHAHPHENRRRNVVWALFIIFVLGPCEPLIPLLIYPAAEGGFAHAAIVAAVFGIATMATMITIVLVGSFGLRFVPMKRLARFSHAIAGAVVSVSGALILFVGL